MPANAKREMRNAKHSRGAARRGFTSRLSLRVSRLRLSSAIQDQGNPAPPELLVERLETSRHLGAAIRARAFGCQSIVLDAVPVANDQRLLASGAIRRTAGGIVHVAGVDVMQAF